MTVTQVCVLLTFAERPPATLINLSFAHYRKLNLLSLDRVTVLDHQVIQKKDQDEQSGEIQQLPAKESPVLL